MCPQAILGPGAKGQTGSVTTKKFLAGLVYMSDACLVPHIFHLCFVILKMTINKGSNLSQFSKTCVL